jgi:sugar lactone lactonase YvrE
MKRPTATLILSCICVTAVAAGQSPAWAQGPGSASETLANAPACTPAGPFSPNTAAPPRRDLPVTAIPGVVVAGVAWSKVWQQAGNSSDGLIPDKDGHVLMAQEDYDTVLRLDQNGAASAAAATTKGLGALSMDRQGRLYAAERTERPGSTKPDKASILNAIAIVAPKRQTIGPRWAGGAPAERPNDLIADNHGGAYFTAECLYYAGSKGVATVAENLHTNGINLSPDEKTLYVTNGPTIVAFDVKGVGVLANRRDFATLQAGGSGDGIAIDTTGRLFVSSGPGVQVFDKAGKFLGIIPTPRSVISITLAGPDRKTLYIAGSGADDAQGQPIRQGPQQTAATVYSLPVLAQGIVGHAK